MDRSGRPPAQGLHPLPAHRAYATEVSDASGTLLLDVAHRRWSRDLLSKLQIDPALLPVLREPRGLGQISDLGASATGLAAGTRSSAAAATSRPAPSATGSSGRASSRRRWGPRGWSSPTPRSWATTRSAGSTLLPRRAGHWHVMGVMLAAGGSLQWFRNQLGKAEVEMARERRRPLLSLVRRGRDGPARFRKGSSSSPT